MRFVCLPVALLILFVTAGGPGAAAAAPAAIQTPGVLCLAAQPNHDKLDFRQSLLLRELVRQAVLVAAREELGLATRDATLREPFPAAGARVLLADGHADETGTFQAVLADPSANGLVLWRRAFPAEDRKYAQRRKPVLEVLEAASRGEIRDLLRKASGAAAAPATQPARSDAPLPAEVEDRLGKLDYFAQVGVLRQLHAEIRDGGDSPERVGALVRAYANLGQLTQMTWGATHQAMAARSLVYAQRMVARDPGSPWPLWHRAYAWAMAGAHDLALADLAAAAERAKATKAEPPAWLALIDALCRYDTTALLRAFSEDRDAKTAPLAAYCAFVSVEHAQSRTVQMQFAQAARELNPSCLRPIDAMSTIGGVAALHQLTLEGPEVFKRSIFNDLPKAPNLPPAVASAVRDGQPQANIPKTRATIAQALIDAGDAGADRAEPSWAVLGRVMQDTFFVHAHTRAHFMAFSWGVGDAEVTSYAQAAKALVGDHPYMPVIEAYGKVHDFSRFIDTLAAVTYGDVTVPMIRLATRISGVPKLKVGERTLWHVLSFSLDDVAWDLERAIGSYGQTAPSAKLRFAHVLREVSPHSPTGVAVLIQDEWEASQPQLAAWERDFENHPTVAAALARGYAAANRDEDAKRMWGRVIAVSPDVDAYRSLARIHLRQGDEVQWLATMEQALTAPDFALSHARVRVDVADHFMEKGDYRRALPYATTAAETWAGWAMWCASRCYEGLEDWRNADLWARRVAERYDESAAEWLVFCRRTGKGDERAALQMARQFVGRNANPGTANMARYCGMIHLLAREPAAAAKHFATGLAKFQDPDCGMLAALAYDAAGDAAARDAAWDALFAVRDAVENPEEWRRFFELVTLLEQQSAGAGSKDAAKVEAHLATEDTPPKAFYWAGRFFRSRGNDEAAKAFYVRCATTSPGMNRTLAWAELRELGVEPRSLKFPKTSPVTEAE